MYESLAALGEIVKYFFCSVVKYFKPEKKEKGGYIELDPRNIIHEDDTIKDQAGRLTKIIYFYKGEKQN